MIRELFAIARLVPQGPLAWQRYIANVDTRVYVLVREGEVVYIGRDPHLGAQRLQEPYTHQSEVLWAYWASTNDPSSAEAEMLRWFSRHFHQLPRGNQQ